MELIYKSEYFRIVGAAMEVHRKLGCGFFEAVYQEALAIEFDIRGIPHEREEKLEIYHKNNLLEKYYVADFVCYDNIIVELKAVNALESVHEAQVFNNLKATSCKLGVLINFGASSLEHKRLIYTQ